MDIFTRIESEKLAAKERHRRRQMRIIQVREQTLNWLSKSREKYEEEKSRQVKILVDELTTEIEEEMIQQIEVITEAHDLAIGEIGAAHRTAVNSLITPEDLDDNKKMKRLKDNFLAEDRFKAALKREREVKSSQKENSSKLQKIREKIRMEANIQAKEISARLPFKLRNDNADHDHSTRNTPSKQHRGPPLYQQSLATSLYIPPDVVSVGKVDLNREKRKIAIATKLPPSMHTKKTPGSPKNTSKGVEFASNRFTGDMITAKKIPTSTTMNASKGVNMPPKKSIVASLGGVFSKVAEEKMAAKAKQILKTTEAYEFENTREPVTVTKYKRIPIPSSSARHSTRLRVPAVDYYDSSIPSKPLKYIPPVGLVQIVSKDSKKLTAWKNAEKQNRERQALDLKKTQDIAEKAKKAEERGKNAMVIAKLDQKMKQLSNALFEQEQLGHMQQDLKQGLHSVNSRPSLVGLDEVSPPQSLIDSSTISEVESDGEVPNVSGPIEYTFKPYETTRVAQLAKENISWIDKQLELNTIRQKQLEIPNTSLQDKLDAILNTTNTGTPGNLSKQKEPPSLLRPTQKVPELPGTTKGNDVTNQTVKAARPSFDQSNLQHLVKLKGNDNSPMIPESLHINRGSDNSTNTSIKTPPIPSFGSEFRAIHSPSSTDLTASSSSNSSSNTSGLELPGYNKLSIDNSTIFNTPQFLLPTSLEQSVIDHQLETLNLRSEELVVFKPVFLPKLGLEKLEVTWFQFDSEKQTYTEQTPSKNVSSAGFSLSEEISSEEIKVEVNSDTGINYGGKMKSDRSDVSINKIRNGDRNSSGVNSGIIRNSDISSGVSKNKDIISKAPSNGPVSHGGNRSEGLNRPSSNKWQARGGSMSKAQSSNNTDIKERNIIRKGTSIPPNTNGGNQKGVTSSTGLNNDGINSPGTNKGGINAWQPGSSTFSSSSNPVAEVNIRQSWSTSTSEREPDNLRVRIESDSEGSTISSVEKTDGHGSYIHSPNFTSPAKNKSSIQRPLTSTPKKSIPKNPSKYESPKSVQIVVDVSTGSTTQTRMSSQSSGPPVSSVQQSQTETRSTEASHTTTAVSESKTPSFSNSIAPKATFTSKTPPPLQHHYLKECVDRPRWKLFCRDITSEDTLSRKDSPTTPRTSNLLKQYIRQLLNKRPESIEALSSVTSSSSNTSTPP